MLSLSRPHVFLQNGQCSVKMKYEAADGQLAGVTLPCTAHRPRSRRNPHSDDLIDFDSLQSDDPDTTQEFKCLTPSKWTCWVADQ